MLLLKIWSDLSCLIGEIDAADDEMDFGFATTDGSTNDADSRFIATNCTSS